jgi:hypothetical protein
MGKKKEYNLDCTLFIFGGFPMAMVSGRWFTMVKFVGSDGRPRLRRYEQSNPADYAAALVSQTAILTDLAGVTDAVIAGCYTYQEVYNDAITLPTDVKLDDEAVLTFRLTNPLKTGTVTIPGAKASIYEGATGPAFNIVDIEDAAVLAFAANFLLDALFWVSDGEQADELIAGARKK